MIGYYYLISLGIALLTISLTIIFRKKMDKHKQLIYKVFSLLLLAVFFVRYMSGDDAIKNIIGLDNALFQNGFLTAMSTISIWFMYASIILIILFPFFKVKYLSLFVKYFSPFVILINLIFCTQTIVGIEGGIALNVITYRAVLMSIEIGLSIWYCFYVWYNNHELKWTKKDVWVFCLSIIGMLIATMPAYVPQILLGYQNPNLIVENFAQWHRIYFYFAFIIPIIIYFFLRNCDMETKRFALLYISVGALFTFMCSAKFDSWLDPTRWPLHLCNTAMYIIVLCLVFKWKKLFYFTFFINVLGALLAMLMPNTSGNIVSYDIIRFWNNHYIAFFMPLLTVALGLFKRPKLKEFIYSAIAFTIYFVLIAFINAWFSKYGQVDFFFINSDFVAEKLGQWAEDLRDYKVSFRIGDFDFVLYPLYQFLFWLVYILVSAGVWFLYEQSYVYFDFIIDMTERKKKYKLDMLALEIKLNGKEITSPMNVDNSNKLILRNFTKRYGNSSVYAVKDVNLEVVGGEIFGFLGPNGAGKSTIIKTIVGIQPITSGQIEVCGYDANTQSVMAKKQIGFVPDHYALYEKLTGREYINYIADLYEVNQKDRDERIEKYLNLFELKFAFDNQIKTYSHGMKQKIAIIAALIHNPKIWILDEPLTGLDPNSIFQVKECMKNHAKEGNIVFFSSHIIDVVERICDRIGIIKKGQLQIVKNVDDIIKSNQPLEEFYMDIINNSDVKEIRVENDENVSDNKSKKKKNSFLSKFKRKSDTVVSQTNNEKVESNIDNQEVIEDISNIEQSLKKNLSKTQKKKDKKIDIDKKNKSHKKKNQQGDNTND